MENLETNNHSSNSRLHRHSLLPKAIFWSWLAVLFFTQQIASAFAQETHAAVETIPQLNLLSTESLVSIASVITVAVITVGIFAVWRVWDAARTMDY